MQITLYLNSDFMQHLPESSDLYKRNLSNIFTEYEINVENIDEETIIAILKNVVKSSKEQFYKDVELRLDGGFCVYDNTQSIQHQCCNDFSNMENWRDLLKANNCDWTMLWIGHPWIYVKNDDDFVYLSDYDENKDAEKVIKFQFPKFDFLALLAEKIDVYDKFRTNVLSAVKNSDLEHKIVLAKNLF